MQYIKLSQILSKFTKVYQKHRVYQFYESISKSIKKWSKTLKITQFIKVCKILSKSTIVYQNYAESVKNPEVCKNLVKSVKNYKNHAVYHSLSNSTHFYKNWSKFIKNTRSLRRYIEIHQKSIEIYQSLNKIFDPPKAPKTFSTMKGWSGLCSHLYSIH